MALFTVSFISWDVGPAMFNSACTVGQLIMSGKDFPKSTTPALLVLAAQFCGSFVGYFMTLATVYKISYGIDSTCPKDGDREEYKYQINT